MVSKMAAAVKQEKDYFFWLFFIDDRMKSMVTMLRFTETCKKNLPYSMVYECKEVIFDGLQFTLNKVLFYRNFEIICYPSNKASFGTFLRPN